MKRQTMLTWFGCALLFSQLVAADNHENVGQSLHSLMDADWQYFMNEYPEVATLTGYVGQSDHWTDLSPSSVAARRNHVAESVMKLRQMDTSKFTEDDRLNYELYLSTLNEAAEGAKFGLEYRVVGLTNLYMPLDRLGGVHLDIIRTVEQMPAQTDADYAHILARLKAVPTLIDQTIEWMKQGLEKGLTPPQVVLRDIPQQIKDLQGKTPDESPLFDHFRSYPESIPSARRDEISAEARATLVNAVFRSYGKLLEFLQNDYIPKARKTLAYTALPDGESRYRFLVRSNTTLAISPEAIHRKGLSEVKRIRAEMDRVISTAKPGLTFRQFIKFVQNDDHFYYSTPAELITGYRDLGKQADAASVRFFTILPRLPYGIEPFPAYMERSQPSGRHVRGSIDAGRPGIFFVNTYDLRARPVWGMQAMILHEAVPGHHFQKALAQEIRDNPPLRAWRDLPAFEEGWALYCEKLGTEMGFYKDPYSQFGRLSDELLRAIRLVVDTGLHTRGWTRERSFQYFEENSPLANQDVTVEIDRYLAWPGQALSYKIGELKIMELRELAEHQLVNDFDLRRFHDAILMDGPLPLELLDRRMREHLARGLMNTQAGKGKANRK